MSHMLPMAAGQISHPITFFIPMITDNGLVHTVMEYTLFVIGLSLPFFEPELRALGRREVDPPFVCVLVKTAEKHDLPVKMSKL